MAPKLLKKNLQIAIDGPVAAGKGTVARLLAKKLNLLYLDTGAMYRAVALLGLENDIDLKDEKALLALLKKTRLEIKPPKKNSPFSRVFLNGREVTLKIRTPQVSWGSSVVATLPGIRRYLVSLQQKIARSQAVVMEGRDITTVVLPNADLKIYMTASQKERARRRFLQLKKLGTPQPFSQVLEETKKRDYQDSHRSANPLVVAPDAWVLDTTRLTIPQVVNAILEKLHQLKLIQ